MTAPILRGVRGAITVPNDTVDDIREATHELLETIVVRNDLVPGDMVSIIFTTTPDLTAEFPAVAARELGLSGVPLLCAQEIPVAGALGQVIRVLIHCYAPPERAIRHVYLRQARQLRMDLPE